MDKLIALPNGYHVSPGMFGYLRSVGCKSKVEMGLYMDELSEHYRNAANETKVIKDTKHQEKINDSHEYSVGEKKSFNEETP